MVLEGAKPLDVGIPAQVFTTRPSMPYSVRVCGVRAGLVPGADGLSYHVEQGLEALEGADIVFIPGYLHPDTSTAPDALLDALRAAHSRGAKLAAISTGAFALAETGLLNGKRATTHWHYTQAFSQRFPSVELNEGVLFVDEGAGAHFGGSRVGARPVPAHLASRARACRGKPRGEAARRGTVSERGAGSVRATERASAKR